MYRPPGLSTRPISADRSSCLPDAAQRPGAHHAVEPPVLERQFLGGLDVKVHVDVAPLDPAAGDPCHPHPRIDRREVTDVFGVMLQVEPGPEADLQDLPVSLGEHLPAEASHAGIPHGPVAQPGEDEAGVETHESARRSYYLVSLVGDDPSVVGVTVSWLRFMSVPTMIGPSRTVASISTQILPAGRCNRPAPLDSPLGPETGCYQLVVSDQEQEGVIGTEHGRLPWD